MVIGARRVLLLTALVVQSAAWLGHSPHRARSPPLLSPIHAAASPRDAAAERRALAPPRRTALEFFSGIGGLHAALQAATAGGDGRDDGEEPPWRVVDAFDVSTLANRVCVNVRMEW